MCDLYQAISESVTPHLNYTMTQVMLSHPMPPLEATSVAMILSNISSTTYETLSFFLISSFTKSTASYDVKQSQIPSQAIIKNAVSPGTIFSFLMSGIAVII